MRVVMMCALACEGKEGKTNSTVGTAVGAAVGPWPRAPNCSNRFLNWMSNGNNTLESTVDEFLSVVPRDADAMGAVVRVASRTRALQGMVAWASRSEYLGLTVPMKSKQVQAEPSTAEQGLAGLAALSRP